MSIQRMKKIIGESILDFTDKFKTDLEYLEYLAEIKGKQIQKCEMKSHKIHCS